MYTPRWSSGWEQQPSNRSTYHHPPDPPAPPPQHNPRNAAATRDRIAALEAQLRLARISLQNEKPTTNNTIDGGRIRYAQVRRDRLNRVVNALEAELYEARDSLQHSAYPAPIQSHNVDDGREPWTWRGRPLAQTARVPKVKPGVSGGRVEDLAMRLMERATEVEGKVARMEALLGAGNSSTRAREQAVQEKLRHGERLGKERADATVLAKKKLEAKAVQLRRQIVEQSAISVQSVFRGHLGRKQMRSARATHDREMRQAKACVAQSHVRGLLARRQVGQVRAKVHREKQQSAAIVIQNQARISLARKQLRSAKTDKQRRAAAATMIQAWFRGCVGRRRVLRARGLFQRDLATAAAVMLQSAWRRVLARNAMRETKREFDRAMEEAAAIMVQAAWRGRQARSKVKGLRREKEQTEDKLMELEWADRVKKQYVAKFFLGVKERAAVRVQGVARSFIARQELKRRRAARAKQDLLVEQERLAREQIRQQAQEAERARQRRQAVQEAEQVAATAAARALRERKEREEEEESQKRLKLATLERHDDGRVVYQGEMVMPVNLPRHDGSNLNLNLMGPEESGIKVRVTVQEVSKPTYQLRFGIYERQSATVFRKEIDAAMLEELIEPLFNARGFTATIDAKPVERAMFNWMATGKPPERKYVIAWLLDRMWFDGASSSADDNDIGSYELCLGSRPAKFDSTLHRTLNAALIDGAARLTQRGGGGQAPWGGHGDEENEAQNSMDPIGGGNHFELARHRRGRQLSDVLDEQSEADGAESWVGLSPPPVREQLDRNGFGMSEAKTPSEAAGSDEDDVVTPSRRSIGGEKKKGRRSSALRRQLPFFRVQRANQKPGV